MHSEIQPSSNSIGLPWYRYAMVWIAILLPACVVVASIFTMVIAFKNAPMIVYQVSPNNVIEEQVKLVDAE